MSAKKLEVYIFIILLMAGAAAFMLYKNKRLVRPRIDVHQPTAANNNQVGGLNLDIFSSDKFKNLRANTFIIREPPEVGKRNPFKPN